MGIHIWISICGCPQGKIIFPFPFQSYGCGDSHRNSVGMGMEIPFPRQPWIILVIIGVKFNNFFRGNIVRIGINVNIVRDDEPLTPSYLLTYRVTISLFFNGNSHSEIWKCLESQIVNRMFIHRTITLYTDIGDVKDRPRSGRPVSVRTRRLREKVRSRNTWNPRCSMLKLAREYLSKETVRKVVDKDLGLKSLKRRKVHHLTPALRERRVERCNGLLQRLAPEP